MAANKPTVLRSVRPRAREYGQPIKTSCARYRTWHPSRIRALAGAGRLTVTRADCI